ncbi:MAG TPA: hypothetical protein DCY01_08365 [Ruminococcus sp.]|nr:ATP-binding protein [Ruminococcus sp.]HBA02237.1 hypothetical protein [Ruminococcus sp.]
MIGKYKKLKQDFENLEKEYSREVAKNLDLQYEYDNLKADYTNESTQRAEIERLHENTRRLKHDMKNHIMVAVSYLNNGEIEQAKNYLSDVLDNLNKTYSYIQTGNSVMNYIINSKLEKAHSKGIGFKAEIENLPFEKMGSVDFSALLSNILDNAVEASEKTTDKFICVAILKKRAYDTILVKNKIDNSVLETNPELKSSKNNTEQHGYGIKQIKTIAEKYDGIVDIYEEDNMFCVNVMIPS